MSQISLTVGLATVYLPDRSLGLVSSTTEKSQLGEGGRVSKCLTMSRDPTLRDGETTTKSVGMH